MLKLIKTNNYFGQHDYIIETDNIDDMLTKLEEIKWTKKPSIVVDTDKILIHCFTNYDKVRIEGAIGNG